MADLGRGGSRLFVKGGGGGVLAYNLHYFPDPLGGSDPLNPLHFPLTQLVTLHRACTVRVK